MIAKLTGKPVVATDAPLEAVVPTFTSMGIGAASAELYREMYAGMTSGHVGYEGGNLRRVRGTVELAETLAAIVSH